MVSFLPEMQNSFGQGDGTVHRHISRMAPGAPALDGSMQVGPI